MEHESNIKLYKAPANGYVVNTLFEVRFFKSKKALCKYLNVYERDLDISLYKVKKGDIKHFIHEDNSIG